MTDSPSETAALPAGNGRTAVVTGGMSGIGAATAQRLRADGLRVLTLDVVDGADFVVDVTDDEALRAAAAGIGLVDVLVNSAGTVGPKQASARDVVRGVAPDSRH